MNSKTKFRVFVLKLVGVKISKKICIVFLNGAPINNCGGKINIEGRVSSQFFKFLVRSNFMIFFQGFFC